MCFSKAAFKECFQLTEPIVSLEENTARNPEFDYDRFKLADIYSSECKANFIVET